MNAWSW
jgi:hypothetical protein